MSGTGFEQLVESRQDWIETVLKPWCRRAALADLRKAAEEWGDIAGRVDPDRTLWLWAWSRFPALHHEGLQGLEESYAVRIWLRDGTDQHGFPDARASRRGTLVLFGDSGDLGPFAIDDIVRVERVES